MDERRLLVIAQDPLARAGLTTLLNDQEGWTLVGDIAPSAALADDVDLYRPDVVIWDAGWELHGHALDTLIQLINELDDLPSPIVLLIPDVEAVADLWDAGIRALLPRDVPVEILLAALSAASVDLTVIDPTFVDAISGPVPLRNDDLQPPVDPLTPREIEVLRHIAEGHSNRAIALEMEISVHTVKFHINAILSKLNASSRTEAVVRATRLGLIFL